MDLKLKHLAHYLPYALKAHCSGLRNDDFSDPVVPKVVEIVGVNLWMTEIQEYCRTITEEYYFEDVFPILRPLSDLTKEIEVNGEKFVPETYLSWATLELLKLHDHVTRLEAAPYFDILKLLEWHFDVFGLIEKGFAIDINTLNQ